MRLGLLLRSRSGVGPFMGASLSRRAEVSSVDGLSNIGPVPFGPSPEGLEYFIILNMDYRIGANAIYQTYILNYFQREQLS